jgi:hypothetical protein
MVGRAEKKTMNIEKPNAENSADQRGYTELESLRDFFQREMVN